MASELGRPVAVGASLQTVARVTAAIAGGLTAVVVARVLGPDGTGAYGVVLATFSLMTVLADLGVSTGAAYRISGRAWPAARAVRQVQIGALVLGVAGAGVALVVATVARDSAFKGVGIGTLAIGLAGLPFALSWIFGSFVALAQDRYERAALPTVTQGLANLALVAVLSPVHGVRGAVVALTVSHALTAAWLAIVGIMGAPRAKGWLAQTPFEIWAAIRFGVKASVTTVLGVVNQRFDLLILNAYAVPAEVGNYSVALSLTALQMLLPMSIGTVVLPRVSSLAGLDAGDHETLVISKSVKHAVVVSTASAIAMAFVLLAVPAVFGGDFQPAVALGWILVPGTAAYGVAYVLAATIVGKGRPGHVLRAMLIVTPATIALYFALIPPFGATGAATASSISYSASMVAYWLVFRRLCAIPLRELLPGRAEIDDYRALAARVRASRYGTRRRP
jgi:O-antigen/teichoic acid export membrane protein